MKNILVRTSKRENLGNEHSEHLPGSFNAEVSVIQLKVINEKLEVINKVTQPPRQPSAAE